VTRSEAIDKLERQCKIARRLQGVERHSLEFEKWERNTQIDIEKIFGKDSREIKDFKNVHYTPVVLSIEKNDNMDQEVYVKGLKRAETVLESMIEKIQEYGIESDQVGVSGDLDFIERICLRFHACVCQLRNRHDKRPAMEIKDEYDVQDLLHAILRLHFEDVRPEEWTPSNAGKSARMDFLLKKERILVETKKTGKSLKADKVRAQLILDRADYEKHPDCDKLVCFVYDPEGWIDNPQGLKDDLENHDGRLDVRVIVAPKT